MVQPDDEEALLRSVAIQNAHAILVARQRAEQELLGAKAALELKTRELQDRNQEIARALDEVHEARRQAEAANRAKDEFIATISHELRQPLTSIVGWVRMLRAGSVDEAGRRHGLDVIDRSARIQIQLVEDLLDVSRMAAGSLSVKLEPVDLSATVEAAVEAARPAADEKEIRLVCALERETGPVSGDPGRLQQVVANLLSNAVKFTPKGGQVEVRLERVGSSVEIRVSDTGQGISPAFLPHVFERFRQADPAAARRHGGLGLGLTIVRHLVELHGGTIHAASLGEGEGATFTVRLPAAGGNLKFEPDARTTDA